MTIDEFKKADLRVGKIISAERVPSSEKLIKLAVDLGEKNEEGVSLPRQILAGIGKVYEPEKLVGREIIVVANLEPRKMMGLESNGMLLAASDDAGSPVILAVEREVPPGSTIK